MNTIQAEMYQPKFGRSKSSWLTIDGDPIEVWFNHKLDLDTLGLALAQIWLYDEDEDKLAWQRISELEEGTSTVVPILVCSDDMDLDCSVIVVEQTIKNGSVVWLRAGSGISYGMQVGATVKWFEHASPPLASFKKTEFEQALNGFKELMKGNS